jgi:hypothetical protein
VINQRPTHASPDLPGVLRGNKSVKSDFFLAVNSNGFNPFPHFVMANKQVQLVLSQKLKHQNFLKCSGLHNKSLTKEELPALENKIHKIKGLGDKRGVVSNLGHDYDDQKMKLGTNFIISDLRVNHRMPLGRKAVTEQTMS